MIAEELFTIADQIKVIARRFEQDSLRKAQEVEAHRDAKPEPAKKERPGTEEVVTAIEHELRSKDIDWGSPHAMALYEAIRIVRLCDKVREYVAEAQGGGKVWPQEG